MHKHIQDMRGRREFNLKLGRADDFSKKVQQQSKYAFMLSKKEEGTQSSDANNSTLKSRLNLFSIPLTFFQLCARQVTAKHVARSVGSLRLERLEVVLDEEFSLPPPLLSTPFHCLAAR